MDFRTGMRLKSAVCSTEIIIVKPPKQGDELRCGGVAMIALTEMPPDGLTITGDARGGTQLGKRYVSEEAGLEILCTKAGEGSLSLNDRQLDIQGAKALPSSD